MKARILLLFLGLASKVLLADQVVVFGTKDFYTVDRIPPPSGPGEPDRLAFFDAFKADLAAQAPLEKALELVGPTGWGKTLGPTTSGQIRFHPVFPGGFVCHLTLSGLEPLHRYLLTLDGSPERAGNALLPSPVPGNEHEHYYDFLFITSDASGHYDAGLGVFLGSGKYDVRLFVKDTQDFKVVLYRDYFEFEVR